MNFDSSSIVKSVANVFQNIDGRTYVLEIGEQNLVLTFFELMNLRKQVQRLSQPQAMTELVQNGSIEIISLYENEHFFILSAKEIIELNKVIERLFVVTA